MKLIKYGFGLVLSVLLVTSCATKFPDYKVVNEDVSWESSGQVYSLAPTEEPIVIKIQRGVADQAISVPFTLTDPEGVFTPSATKVDFAVGEYTKTISLAYSYSSLVPGTEYNFNLAFADNLAGDGCFSEFDGMGMMALEYEDYLDADYYYTYAYGPGRIYRMGPFLESLDGTPVSIKKAKGTNNYYKLTFLDGQVSIEFKAVCEEDGNISISKYSGYNDNLNAIAGGEYTFNYNNSDGVYLFEMQPAYCDLENDSGYLETPVIQAGDQLWIYTWIALNNAWINGGYGFYHVIIFS